MKAGMQNQYEGKVAKARGTKGQKKKILEEMSVHPWLIEVTVIDQFSHSTNEIVTCPGDPKHQTHNDIQ